MGHLEIAGAAAYRADCTVRLSEALQRWWNGADSNPPPFHPERFRRKASYQLVIKLARRLE